MLLLTEDARLFCLHGPGGRVQIRATQDLLTIEKRRVLVETDPERQPITGCPMPPLAQRPCFSTLSVETGYSEWITVCGRRVCLDAITGVTDGDPIGTIHYVVRDPGQSFVSEAP
jgi:hypothetical protein